MREQVIILAMKDMNIAKLTSDDLPLFTGITSDLFPDVDVPTVDYEEINSYITKEAIKLKLQVIFHGESQGRAIFHGDGQNDVLIFIGPLFNRKAPSIEKITTTRVNSYLAHIEYR